MLWKITLNLILKNSLPIFFFFFKSNFLESWIRFSWNLKHIFSNSVFWQNHKSPAQVQLFSKLKNVLPSISVSIPDNHFVFIIFAWDLNLPTEKIHMHYTCALISKFDCLVTDGGLWTPKLIHFCKKCMSFKREINFAGSSVADRQKFYLINLFFFFF